MVREQIHEIYGGNSQAGIANSRTTPNVIVYSDYEKAAANGYDFDGWDESGQVYYYTGEGKLGDQTLERGNRAILDHRADGKALRLFVAVGNLPGTATRIHHYVGEFTVDPHQSYLKRVAPGTDGKPRTVFVFRLLPVGAVSRGRQPHTSPIGGAGQAAEIAAVAVDAVALAAVNTEQSAVHHLISGPVLQKEAQLTTRFQAYLEQRDSKVKRYRIVPAGSSVALFTDIADTTHNIVYEAKGSADRMSVRLALGQILDYGRYVRGSRLAVLLPDIPAADLVELVESLDVGCVVESADGKFVDMTALHRCPL